MDKTILNKAKQSVAAPMQQQSQASTNSKAGKIVKPVAIPALKALEHQLDTQKDNLKESARLLVQSKMAETQIEVRDVVADELATIAGDDDFFGFGSMFESVPTLELPEPEETDETPIDATAVTVEVMPVELAA